MRVFLFISLVMIFHVLVVDWLKVNEVWVAAGECSRQTARNLNRI